MSKKVMHQNNTNKIQYFGSVAVRPGDARPVDAHYLEGVQTSSFDVIEFLEGNVNDIKKRVNDLTDAQLSDAIISEIKGENRKSLLERLDQEVEQRQLDIATKVMTAQLELETTDDLQQMLLDDNNTDEDNALIQSILDARIAQSGDSND